MALTPTEVARHGGADAWVRSQPVQSGRFTFGLETPSLRNVSFDGFEVAQTITFSVRDKGWGTVQSENWSTAIDTTDDRVDITMEGRYTAEGIDLDATINLTTGPDGSLTYSVKAVVLRDFERARIGICVMQPATLAGETLRIDTPDDSYTTNFPDRISASRAISNIVSLSHPIDADRDVVLEFEGELFEFEDQRNWTDNSYKTFCTPLTLPWPVSVSAGDVIQQTLRIATAGPTATERASHASARSVDDAASVDLDLWGKATAPDAPQSDFVPSIGVLCDTDPGALSIAAELGPGHVRLTIDAHSPEAPTDLTNPVGALGGSSTMIELELVADEPADLARFHNILTELRDQIVSVFVIDRTTQITPLEYSSAIDDLCQRTGMNIGGGSGSNFGAINFNFDKVAFGAIKTLTVPMSPQVHYTDDFSIITNLDAQATVAANARRIAEGKPVTIGPITWLPRRAGEPLARDPRSDSLLGAAWTVASMESLMASGVAALTYHKIGGAAGIVTEDGLLTPTYHLLADLSEFRDATRSRTEIDSHGNRVGTISLTRGTESLVIVANVGHKPIDVAVDMPSEGVKIRILDETTYDVAAQGRRECMSLSTNWSGSPLHLLPFAVATLQVSE